MPHFQKRDGMEHAAIEHVPFRRSFCVARQEDTAFPKHDFQHERVVVTSVLFGYVVRSRSEYAYLRAAECYGSIGTRQSPDYYAVIFSMLFDILPFGTFRLCSYPKLFRVKVIEN